MEGAIVALLLQLVMVATGLVANAQMEGAIVALLLYLVMIAIGHVANTWDGGCHCRPPLALGHGCNWACGQCVRWRAPLSPSSCTPLPFDGRVTSCRHCLRSQTPI